MWSRKAWVPVWALEALRPWADHLLSSEPHFPPDEEVRPKDLGAGLGSLRVTEIWKCIRCGHVLLPGATGFSLGQG